MTLIYKLFLTKRYYFAYLFHANKLLFNSIEEKEKEVKPHQSLVGYKSKSHVFFFFSSREKYCTNFILFYAKRFKKRK